VLATHSIRQFPLHFPARASPCAITFQLESNKTGRNTEDQCVGTTCSHWRPSTGQRDQMVHVSTTSPPPPKKKGGGRRRITDQCPVTGLTDSVVKLKRLPEPMRGQTSETNRFAYPPGLAVNYYTLHLHIKSLCIVDHTGRNVLPLLRQAFA